MQGPSANSYLAFVDLSCHSLVICTDWFTAKTSSFQNKSGLKFPIVKSNFRWCDNFLSEFKIYWNCQFYLEIQDRNWRKTRSTNTTTQCVGVDANRNFDFKWMSKSIIFLTQKWSLQDEDSPNFLKPCSWKSKNIFLMISCTTYPILRALPSPN